MGRFYKVTFYMLNARGMKLGSSPVVLCFYSVSDFDFDSLSCRRMLLEYGRSIGRSGSVVEIIEVEKG